LKQINFITEGPLAAGGHGAIAPVAPPLNPALVLEIRQCTATALTQAESCKRSFAMEWRAHVQSYINQT